MGENDFLKLNEVTKLYGKQKALENVSFSIQKGEVVGLVGPNGAGKSTLMKIVVGLIKNYSGNVYFEGRDIKSIVRNKKTIGCVIEDPGFYPHLSGYDNLLFFSKISGCNSKKDIDEVISILGIDSFVHKKAKKYSLGMKQRLGLAQAVLGSPELLILDEPTNGLDANVISDIRGFIKYLSQEKNIAVIISSHILSEIESMCSKVIFIKNGKIVDQVFIKDHSIETEKNYFVFETNDKEALLNILNNENINALIDDGKVIADLNQRSTQDILSLLVNSNIAINEVYKQKENLEKKFIDMMRGNRIE